MPRMNSNHDKVIQSHLSPDAFAIDATFSFKELRFKFVPNG